MWYVIDCKGNALEAYHTFIGKTYGAFATVKNNKSTWTAKLGDGVSFNYYVKEGLFQATGKQYQVYRYAATLKVFVETMNEQNNPHQFNSAFKHVLRFLPSHQ